MNANFDSVVVAISEAVGAVQAPHIQRNDIPSDPWAALHSKYDLTRVTVDPCHQTEGMHPLIFLTNTPLIITVFPFKIISNYRYIINIITLTRRFGRCITPIIRFTTGCGTILFEVRREKDGLG